MDLTFDAYRSCELCPRRCGVDRTRGQSGVCGCSSELRLARAALHYWEEPPLSGDVGSGAIFFSGCSLRCVFCQNHEISHDGVGLVVQAQRLAQIMLELQEQGALNVNLVTPTHYAPHVREALRMARHQGMDLPVVCNTSGYELPELVRAASEDVDVWLTDFKYASRDLAGSLSGARDYPDVAVAALEQMLLSVRARGGRRLGADGSMRQGIVVRVLVLPGHADDACDVLDIVWDMCGNEVDLSVMNQYTPNERCRKAGGELSRTLDEDEYELVLCHADDLGFERMWWQEGGTATESFVPAFDATGVLPGRESAGADF